ncbi:unnamed protein product [Lactuca virosa]|uniref:Uncharacterized protein n=1 Tax=Lactuca virosa TaxID=75947 RepID=A0AAU9NQL6_9ASTR|nr:unnamed protein product [Lactuca virosa]
MWHTRPDGKSSLFNRIRECLLLPRFSAPNRSSFSDFLAANSSPSRPHLAVSAPEAARFLVPSPFFCCESLLPSPFFLQRTPPLPGRIAAAARFLAVTGPLQLVSSMLDFFSKSGLCIHHKAENHKFNNLGAFLGSFNQGFKSYILYKVG